MLAPGLILISILFLASIAWNTIKSQSSSLSYIVEVVFEQQSKGNELRTAFDQTDRRLNAPLGVSPRPKRSPSASRKLNARLMIAWRIWTKPTMACRRDQAAR